MTLGWMIKMRAILLANNFTNVFKDIVNNANAIHCLQAALLFIERQNVNCFSKIFGNAFV